MSMYDLKCSVCGKVIPIGKKYRYFEISVSRLCLNTQPGFDGHPGMKEYPFAIGECCLPSEMLKDELSTDYEAWQHFVTGIKNKT